MNNDITVTLTYTEEEAREVARTFLYFTSNVSATNEDHDRMTLIRTAIKNALPPPKPDEPTGLGAVVEDDQQRLYVNVGTAKLRWRHGSVAYDWREIAAVRVLSEGIA